MTGAILLILCLLHITLESVGRVTEPLLSRLLKHTHGPQISELDFLSVINVTAINVSDIISRVSVVPQAPHRVYVPIKEEDLSNVTEAGFNTSLCPVSMSINLNSSRKYFFYPADIYSPIADELSSAVPCLAQDLASYQAESRYDCVPPRDCLHLCSTSQKYCPVREHHVNDTLHDLKVNRFCTIKEKLINQSHIVNIYVSGGSVTSGSNTIGCCDTSFCAGNGVYAERCSWSYYLSEWINRTFPATVNMHSFAAGGVNSNMAAELLYGKMMSSGVRQFTNSDMFFLDHSVNDNSEASDAMLFQGIESLVREIMTHSKPHSLPLIVIMDASAKSRTGFFTCRYCEAYESVAAHYGIPIWSYRNAVLSNSNDDIKNSRYLDFINFQLGKNLHPPWHVHLFMADLYADVIQRVFSACTSADVHQQKAWHHKTLADFSALNPVEASKPRCTQVVLRLSHDFIVNTLQYVGSFDSKPKDSWQLTQDIQGRMGGFIHQYSDTNAKSLNNATIVFHLNITARELVEKQINISFSMYYLRTYENAGMAEVTYCGKTVSGGTLDALWSKPESLPEKWSPSSSVLSFTHCIHHQQKQQQQQMVSIEVTHYPVRGRVGTQKFKILNVAACF